MFMNGYLEFDAGIFKKAVDLFHPGNLECLVLITHLVVIAIFPQDAYGHQVLAYFISTAEVGAGKESKTTAIYFEGLMNSILHGEVSDFFFITFINGIR